MENKKEKTAPNVSVGADTEQPIQKITENSISEYEENIKSFEEMQREMQLSLDPLYLKTVSMNELLDTQYQSKPPLIDGLLYPGTYIFAGSPKLGKSFMMAQLAYHVSTGTPLWNYTTRKGTVLYLALEDDYRRLQERLYRMFGTESADNLFFSVSASQLGKGLDEQLARFVAEHSNTRLIIIDTLQKVREVGGDNYSYANDYQIMARLKSFADAHGLCILLVGDLFEVVTDTVNPANETGTVSYIGLENIESGTGKIIGKLECDINTIKSTKRVFKNTDILFGKLRPALNKVAFPNKNGVCSTDIIVLRSKSKDTLPEFYSILLRDSEFNKQVLNGVSGGQLPRVDVSYLLSLPIYKVPLAEQREVLNKIRTEKELIESTEKLIAIFSEKIKLKIKEVWGE